MNQPPARTVTDDRTLRIRSTGHDARRRERCSVPRPPLVDEFCEVYLLGDVSLSAIDEPFSGNP
jgi:hypothetical protein